MRSFTARRLSAILLIVSFVLNMAGVLLYGGRNTYGWFIETPTLLAWERGLFIAAYVVALGVALLEIILREAGAVVLVRLGTTAFLMAAVAAIVAETAFLSGLGPMIPLLVVMVVVLFGAEALLRGAAHEWPGASLDRLDDGGLEPRLAGALADCLAR